MVAHDRVSDRKLEGPQVSRASLPAAGSLKISHERHEKHEQACGCNVSAKPGAFVFFVSFVAK
jgi:hypothetical protein